MRPLFSKFGCGAGTLACRVETEVGQASACGGLQSACRPSHILRGRRAEARRRLRRNLQNSKNPLTYGRGSESTYRAATVRERSCCRILQVPLVRFLRLAVGALAFIASGCLHVAPYQRPTLPVPPSYKEAPPEGWKEAQPNDGVLRGKWWEIFGDPALNALEEQVNISNQNVLQIEAQFRQAQAAVRVARTALFPTVTGSPSVTGSQSSSRLGAGPGGGTPTGIYNIPVSASYTADLWGAIHRTVTASANTAQSVDALLENARLLYQSELAVDYFQLHGLDGDADLRSEERRVGK